MKFFSLHTLALCLLATSTLSACVEESYPGATSSGAPLDAPRLLEAQTPVVQTSALQAPARPANGAWLYLVEIAHKDDTRPQGEEAQQWLKDRVRVLDKNKDELLARHGLADDTLWYRYSSLPMVGLWLTEDQKDKLQTDKSVVRTWPAEWMKPSDSSSLAFMGLDTLGDKNADADAGLGTEVAVIDTAARYWGGHFGDCGTENNPSFSQSCAFSRLTHAVDCANIPNIAPGWECAPGQETYEGVGKSDNHGTNVSGIVHSVAPAAKVWMLNVGSFLRPQNQGSGQLYLLNADIVASLEAIHANPGDVTAVNMSLGSARSEGQWSYCTSAFQTAFRNLWHNRDILAIVATGNDGNKNSISAPACDPYAFSVGAHYDTQYHGYSVQYSSCSDNISQGNVTCFSNSQTSVDLIAPGGFIEAAGVTQSGTSQATPHVAGYAAKIKSDALRGETNRDLTAPELFARLRHQSVNHQETTQGQDNASYSYGHRRLSATSALSPNAHYFFHSDPDGLNIGPGVTATMNIDTRQNVDREGSKTGHQVQKTWLDLNIATGSAPSLNFWLTSPTGTRRKLSGVGGFNVNHLFGDVHDSSLADNFADETAQGVWTLEVANTSTTLTATVHRAALMLQTEQVLPAQPASLDSFTVSEPTVKSDGVEVQTFSATFNNGARINELRLLVNHPSHAQNGASPAGYLQLYVDTCRELGRSLGNDTLELVPDSCSRTLHPSGAVTFSVSVTMEPGYPVATNHQVSALWFEDQALSTSWRRMTPSGAGFETTAPDQPPVLPASLRSFSMLRSQLTADGQEAQVFRIVLDDASQVEDLRILVNFPSHATNGQGMGGYMRITPTLCHELTASYGNNALDMQTDDCERNSSPDGSIEYVVAFFAQPGYVAANDYQVSVLWFEEGQAKGWRRATEPGQGMDIAAGTGNLDRPSTFGSFSMDRTSVQADGQQLQTLRLVLNDASQVDDIRILLNHAPHATNGRSNTGYFRITDTACKELTTRYGNDLVTLQTETCERNAQPGGAIEYVLHFAVEPGFGAATDNQVSVVWFEQGQIRSSWRQLTSDGTGFDVVP